MLWGVLSSHEVQSCGCCFLWQIFTCKELMQPTNLPVLNELLSAFSLAEGVSQLAADLLPRPTSGTLEHAFCGTFAYLDSLHDAGTMNLHKEPHVACHSKVHQYQIWENLVGTFTLCAIFSSSFSFLFTFFRKSWQVCFIMWIRMTAGYIHNVMQLRDTNLFREAQQSSNTTTDHCSRSYLGLSVVPLPSFAFLCLLELARDLKPQISTLCIRAEILHQLRAVTEFAHTRHISWPDI